MRLACLAASSLMLSGCGYMGDPMYPLLNIPNRVTDLAVVQRGATLIYQFTLPLLTTEGKQAKIGSVLIYAGEPGAGNFNQSEWEKSATRIEAAAASAGHVRGEIPAARWVRKDVVMGVKVYGVNKKDAGFSNLKTVTVLAALAPPAGIEAVAVTEGVRVSWKGPGGQFRIFRRGEQDKDYVLMATVEGNEWVDTTTDYGKRYDYIVQAVEKTGNGEVESEVSEAKSVTPIDIFPPAIPTGLNAIVATEGIELVWDRNTEPDLAGYRLYRAAGDGAFEKIAEIAETPSYSDRKVERGKRYRYEVSSVDRLGNESKPSAAVEITAP